MAHAELLRNFASGRDDRGIPILCKTRNVHEATTTKRTRETLIECVKKLRLCYDKIDFLRLRILPVWPSYRAHHVERLQPSTALNIDVQTEIASLHTLLEEHGPVLQLLLNLQDALSRYQLGPIPPSLPLPRTKCDPFLEPQMLMRAFLEGQSHTYWDNDLGFRSSGYRKCRPVKDIEAMIKEGVLNTKSMRNHCEGEPEPSHWISMTDNPQWLMERSLLCRGDIQRYDKRRVAFVNVEKLNRMGVIFQRSDLLALQANIAVYSTSNQQGVKYTSVDHWLAFSWIPPQCIERIVSLRSFRALYKAHGFESECDFLQPSALANINAAQTLFSNVCQKNCSRDLRTQRFWISSR